MCTSRCVCVCVCCALCIVWTTHTTWCIFYLVATCITCLLLTSWTCLLSDIRTATIVSWWQSQFTDSSFWTWAHVHEAIGEARVHWSDPMCVCGHVTFNWSCDNLVTVIFAKLLHVLVQACLWYWPRYMLVNCKEGTILCQNNNHSCSCGTTRCVKNTQFIVTIHWMSYSALVNGVSFILWY